MAAITNGVSVMMQSLKTLFWVSRPVSWINTAYPFAAGYLVTGGRDPLVFAIGTMFFLIPYNLLMYGINDVFDYESDILNPRKGGIEGATANRAFHRTIIWASVGLCLPFLAFLFTLGDAGTKLWLAYAIFMVLAYSAPVLRFKERPFLDSFTSATHFASPMVFAFLLNGWHAAYWPATLAFFAWGMASHALGAVQDIIPDRLAGIASVASIIGARSTLILVGSLYAISGLLLVAYGLPGVIVALVALPFIHNAVRFIKLTDATSPKAHAAWRRFLWLNWVSGFVITQVLIWRLFI